MFWIGFIVGGIIGGTITLILYACVVVGKESEKFYEYRE